MSAEESEEENKEAESHSSKLEKVQAGDPLDLIEPAKRQEMCIRDRDPHLSHGDIPY